MANRPFVLNKSSFYIGFWLFACTCTIRPVFLFFHEQYTIAMSFCTRVLVGVRSTTHDVPNCKPVSGALNHGADSAPKEFTVRARSAHALLHEAQIPAKQKRYCFLLSRPASRPSGNFAAVARENIACDNLPRTKTGPDPFFRSRTRQISETQL